jgi:hypothetical protein
MVGADRAPTMVRGPAGNDPTADDPMPHAATEGAAGGAQRALRPGLSSGRDGLRGVERQWCSTRPWWSAKVPFSLMWAVAALRAASSSPRRTGFAR